MLNKPCAEFNQDTATYLVAFEYLIHSPMSKYRASILSLSVLLLYLTLTWAEELSCDLMECRET